MSIAKKLMVVVLLVSGSMFGQGDEIGKQLNQKLSEIQTMVCCGIATTLCCLGYSQCPAGGVGQMACYAAAAGALKLNAGINEKRTEMYNNPENYIKKQPSAMKKIK